MMKISIEYANKLIFVKAYGQAQELIEKIVENDGESQDLKTHLRRIELSVKLNNVRDLILKYEKILEVNHDDKTAHLAIILAKQHGEQLTPQESMVEFQNFIKKFGSHPAAFYGIGYSMEIQGYIDRALANYEQCVNLDGSWYPGYFGLSQAYYQLGDNKKGDYYFYLFEEQAPYTVYGNFETHKKLCEEFLVDDEFKNAVQAIKSLAEWWIENKGFCPTEINLYEKFSLSRIADKQGRGRDAKRYRSQADDIAQKILDDAHSSESVLYFVAKTLEEFSELEMSLKFYKKILSKEVTHPEMVQKIGGQFISLGEFRLAKELFSEAYKYNPDNSEIRFCLLVSDLRLNNINVEEYMIGKERLKKLIEGSGEKVELLSLLNNLLSMYSDDPDIHGHIADCHLALGNFYRAKIHYKKMYDLDSRSTISSLKFASFEMQYGDMSQAKSVLEGTENLKNLTADQLTEIHWMKSTFYLREKDYHKSLQHLRKIQILDPWNVSYLIQEIVNMSALHYASDPEHRVDGVIEQLKNNNELSIDWHEFDRNTKIAEKEHYYELVYVRQKLRFLYSRGDDTCLRRLVSAACRYHPEKGTSDFLKLLNTNFDGPNIYFALGVLFKELWQLETASMWMEQVLISPTSSDRQRAKAYLELADCFVWRDNHLPKAIEFVKLAMELGERKNKKCLTVLAHALLRAGQVREAKIYLEENEVDSDPEALYLKGLVEYRNGAKQKANQIWKPLLTVPSESLRFHHIKQEVLRYYFDKTSYRTERGGTVQ